MNSVCGRESRSIQLIIGSHRFEFGHIPLQGLSHVHHLGDDVLQLLHTHTRAHTHTHTHTQYCNPILLGVQLILLLPLYYTTLYCTVIYYTILCYIILYSTSVERRVMGWCSFNNDLANPIC